MTGFRQDRYISMSRLDGKFRFNLAVALLLGYFGSYEYPSLIIGGVRDVSTQNEMLFLVSPVVVPSHPQFRKGGTLK